MLDERFASVLAAKDAADFRARVLRFTKWLGFDLMNAFVAADRPDGGTTFHSVELGWSDPVMQHCKQSGTPILWGQSTYVEAGLPERWEHQAVFGYRVGIGVALHLPRGLHFMIGVDRDQPLPVSVPERRRLAAELCLFAAFAHEAAAGVLLCTGCARSAPGRRLSARELEVLGWSADGKTAWEIGRILGISEQTVTRHALSAAQKLGCVNKVQAVAKALRLGLLN
jgi:DNA-binding CsgD family transcriptional regulator